MYNYHPLRLAKSNILKQYFSHGVNDVSDGSPSRMRSVRRISLGMTILPRSSTLRTIPVAFIVLSLLALRFLCYCLQELGNYAKHRKVCWQNFGKKRLHPLFFQPPDEAVCAADRPFGHLLRRTSPATRLTFLTPSVGARRIPERELSARTSGLPFPSAYPGTVPGHPGRPPFCFHC